MGSERPPMPAVASRDWDLVVRCQAGDPAAFDELYTEYFPRLRRFCQRRLGDRQDAEDVAQEAFVRAWRALPRFAQDRRFYPWLTVIAANLCTDHQRRRWRSVPTADVDVLAESSTHDGAPTAEDHLWAARDARLARQALGRLSRDQQRLLELRAEAEWSTQRIAQHEGVSVTTIETRLWRARKALRRQFDLLSDGRAALGGAALSAAAAVRRWATGAAGRWGAGGPAGQGLRNALAAVAVTTAIATSAGVTPSSSATDPVPGRAAAAQVRDIQGPSSAPIVTTAGPTPSAPVPPVAASSGATSTSFPSATAPVAGPLPATTSTSSGAPLTAILGPLANEGSAASRTLVTVVTTAVSHAAAPVLATLDPPVSPAGPAVNAFAGLVPISLSGLG